MSERERMLAYLQRCRYYHRRTLKSTTQLGVEVGVGMHRCPSWMPLRMHLCLEKLLSQIPFRSRSRPAFFSSRVSIPYHIIHGLICDYAMKDIVKFIQSLGDRRFYVNTYMKPDSS